MTSKFTIRRKLVPHDACLHICNFRNTARDNHMKFPQLFTLITETKLVLLPYYSNWRIYFTIFQSLSELISCVNTTTIYRLVCRGIKTTRFTHSKVKKKAILFIFI